MAALSKHTQQFVICETVHSHLPLQENQGLVSQFPYFDHEMRTQDLLELHLLEDRDSKRDVDLPCVGAENKTALDGVPVDGQTQVGGD